MCVFLGRKIWDISQSFFTKLIPKFGASGWKIEAPQTTSLAPGASIGGNTVCIEHMQLQCHLVLVMELPYLVLHRYQSMRLRMSQTSATCSWWREHQNVSWTAAQPSWSMEKRNHWERTGRMLSTRLTWNLEVSVNVCSVSEILCSCLPGFLRILRITGILWSLKCLEPF